MIKHKLRKEAPMKDNLVHIVEREYDMVTNGSSTPRMREKALDTGPEKQIMKMCITE